MANGKAALSGLNAALDKLVKKIKQFKIVKLIKCENRVIVAGIATGILFLLLAVIQLIIITFGKVPVYFDNVLLIVTDFVVAAISGVIALRRAAKLGKGSVSAKPTKRSKSSQSTNITKK